MNRLIVTLLFSLYTVLSLCHGITLDKSVFCNNENGCVIKGHVVHYNICNNQTEQYSYVELSIDNCSNETIFVLFDDRLTPDINIYDYIYDKFFLGNNTSLYHAIYDLNTVACIELAIKRIKPGDTFTILMQGNEDTSYRLRDKIVILSLSQISKYSQLKKYENIDSWIFNVPDILYLPPNFIYKKDSETTDFSKSRTDGTWTEDKILDKIHEYADDILKLSKNKTLTDSILTKWYSSRFIDLYRNLDATDEPIFNSYSIDVRDIVISIDPIDMAKNHNTLKINISYLNMKTGNPEIRSLRVIKNKTRFIIDHVYNLVCYIDK